MKDRNSNFELMRIVSMFFIILWHIIMHGHMINNCHSDFIKIILQLIQFIIIIHVNSFVVLSGYFQSKSKFKLSKLLSLFLQVIFYLCVIFFVAVKLGFVTDYNIATIVNKMLFSSINEYWFIKMYIIIYIFSDYINKFIDRLSRLEYKNLLLLLFFIFSIMSFVTGGKFFINDGYNFYNFIFLYMIGGYLRRYPLKETYHFKRFSKNGYICFMIFIFFMMSLFNFLLYYFVSNTGEIDSSLFNEFVNRINYSKLSYSSPFVIIQTICYFEIFGMISVKSNLINFISSCTFGIYLFHDNNIVRANIYKLLKIDNGMYGRYGMVVYMFLIMILIFILGLVIEIIRKIIFYFLDKFVVIKKIKLWIKNFISSFGIVIPW